MRGPGSIAGRLRAGFAVIALLFAVAAGFIYLGVSRQSAAIRQLTGHAYVLQRSTALLALDFTTSQLAIGSYAITGERRFLPQFDAARADFSRQLSTIRREAPASMDDLIGHQATAGRTWFVIAGQVTASPGNLAVNKRQTDGAWTMAGRFYPANTAMQERLAATITRLTNASKREVGVGLAWSGLALAVALGLALVTGISTVRRTTKPLRGVTGTVRRLASGDLDARAEVSGAAEIQEVATSVNMMADENGQLRRSEEESARLRAMAREAGIRIRESLNAEGVLREACAAVVQCLASDLGWLSLLPDGTSDRLKSAARDWALPVIFLTDMPESFVTWTRELLRGQRSTVVQDLRSRQGESMPARFREPLLAQGVVSHLATPFGIDSEAYGIIQLERTRPENPWTEVEVDVMQSIAADLGRGLRHAHLYEEENRLVEELKSLDRAKSDFLATVSHELRTPLTSIAGYVEMLKDGDAGPLTPTQEGMLEAVDRNSGRLRNLIEDVLTLSKIESRAFKTAMVPVSITDIVSGAVEALRPAAAKKGLGLGENIPDAEVMVSGDAGQLDRMLMNLLSNAVKFTPEGGTVSVGVAVAGDHAVVTVTDTGIGIPEDGRKVLFTRFFRASNAVEQSIPGTGLGLAIVRTIIENHGGKLNLDSREGEGTTVAVRLPLSAPGGQPGPGPAESGPAEGGTAEARRAGGRQRDVQSAHLPQ